MVTRMTISSFQTVGFKLEMRDGGFIDEAYIVVESLKCGQNIMKCTVECTSSDEQDELIVSYVHRHSLNESLLKNKNTFSLKCLIFFPV